MCALRAQSLPTSKRSQFWSATGITDRSTSKPVEPSAQHLARLLVGRLLADGACAMPFGGRHLGLG